MQPYFDPNRKTTLKKMEDNLKKQKNEEDLKKTKMSLKKSIKDNLKKNQSKTSKKN